MFTAVVETTCGPVEYAEAGTGHPLLYFHGTGVTGDVMLAVEASLVRDGFRLIVPNRPGYGRTPLAPHHAAAGCARVAAALLDTLGIARVSVMGSSGGAAFAVAFAIHHADRVSSLVLLCPQVHRWDHPRWLPTTSRWTLPFLRRPWTRKLLLRLYRILLRHTTSTQLLRTQAGARYPDVAEDPACRTLCEITLAAMVRGTHHAGFENDFVVFTEEGPLDAGTSLQVPTLILHDAEDPLAPVEHVDWLVSRCAACERVSVHAAGHLVWVGPQASVLHQARVRFLEEHAGSSPQVPRNAPGASPA